MVILSEPDHIKNARILMGSMNDPICWAMQYALRDDETD